MLCHLTTAATSASENLIVKVERGRDWLLLRYCKHKHMTGTECTWCHPDNTDSVYLSLLLPPPVSQAQDRAEPVTAALGQLTGSTAHIHQPGLSGGLHGQSAGQGGTIYGVTGDTQDTSSI